MPSIDQSSKRDEDKEWKGDMWLLRALIKQTVADLIGVPTEDFTLADIEESDPDIVHAACDYKEYPYEWLTLTKDYGNADSATTLPLGLRMEQMIRERGLWKIYEERMKLPQIAFEMEERGVTASEVNTLGVIEQYGMEAAEAEDQCVSIAKKYGHDLELPAGATVNDSLREFFYGSTWLECPRCGKETKVKEWSDVLKDDNQLCPKCEKKGKGHALVHTKVHRRRNLGLEKVYSEKTGNPTLDKDAMAYYLATLEGEPWDFVDALMTKRSRAVAQDAPDVQPGRHGPPAVEQLQLQHAERLRPGGLAAARVLRPGTRAGVVVDGLQELGAAHTRLRVWRACDDRAVREVQRSPILRQLPPAERQHHLPRRVLAAGREGGGVQAPAQEQVQAHQGIRLREAVRMRAAQGRQGDGRRRVVRHAGRQAAAGRQAHRLHYQLRAEEGVRGDYTRQGYRPGQGISDPGVEGRARQRGHDHAVQLPHQRYGHAVYQQGDGPVRGEGPATVEGGRVRRIHHRAGA